MPGKTTFAILGDMISYGMFWVALPNAPPEEIPIVATDYVTNW